MIFFALTWYAETFSLSPLGLFKQTSRLGKVLAAFGSIIFSLLWWVEMCLEQNIEKAWKTVRSRVLKLNRFFFAWCLKIYSQTWKTSFCFCSPTVKYNKFLKYLWQYGLKILFKFKKKHNLNHPIYGLFYYDIVSMAFLSLFLWIYLNISSIFGRFFRNSQMFPRPWVSWVAPFPMSICISRWCMKKCQIRLMGCFGRGGRGNRPPRIHIKL